MRRSRTIILLCLVALLAQSPTQALETDPYLSWGHELDDAIEPLNAKVNLEIDKVLDRLGRRRAAKRLSCQTVADHISAHFRTLIFHPVEIWASKSPLVDRWPPTEEEELQSKRHNLLGNRGPWDIGGWLPESPTIELHGVRVGTDKLAHFFSGGGSYYRFYNRFLAQGIPADEAQREVIDRGIFSEKTFLGYGTSGVLSAADLEANFRGMQFLLGLCDGPAPLLTAVDGRFKKTREFDFRAYVTVEWDESYNNSGFVKRRWKKVLPRLRQHCGRLQDPWVVERRRRYAERDVVTPTEARIAEQLAAGRIDDLRQFSLDSVCRPDGG